MRGESVRVSTIAATAITAALIPMQSAHSRTTFRSRTTTCDCRRLVSREVQVQPTIEPTRHRSHSELFATGVWTHESMRVPTWHLQGTNSCHGLPDGCGHRLPSAMDGAWLNLGPTLVKVLVLPGEDPLFLLWRSRGAIGRVHTTPGALPTAAASMDGSDGRPDGRPGEGKGLKWVRLSRRARSHESVLNTQCVVHLCYC